MQNPTSIIIHDPETFYEFPVRRRLCRLLEMYGGNIEAINVLSTDQLWNQLEQHIVTQHFPFVQEFTKKLGELNRERKEDMEFLKRERVYEVIRSE